MCPYLLPPVHCAPTDPSVHLWVKHSGTLRAKSVSHTHWVMVPNRSSLVRSLACAWGNEKENSEPTEWWPHSAGSLNSCVPIISARARPLLCLIMREISGISFSFNNKGRGGAHSAAAADEISEDSVVYFQLSEHLSITLKSVCFEATLNRIPKSLMSVWEAIKKVLRGRTMPPAGPLALLSTLSCPQCWWDR